MKSGEMKHEMTLSHTIGPNRNLLFQAHLIFVTILVHLKVPYYYAMLTMLVMLTAELNCIVLESKAVSYFILEILTIKRAVKHFKFNYLKVM